MDPGSSGSADPQATNQMGDPDVAGGAGEPVSIHLVPQLCGDERVQTHVGAGVAQAALAQNGSVGTDHVTAFALSERGLLATATERGSFVTERALATGGAVARVAAGHVAGRDVVATISAKRELVVSTFSPDLRDVRELVHGSALALAPDPIVAGPARTLVMPTIDEAGLHITALDGNFEVQADKLYTDGDRFDGVAAASFGGNAMIAWSTADRCHLQWASAELPTDGTTLTVPCPNPQLAIDAHGTAVVAYVAPNGVMVVRAPGQVFGTEELVGRGGHDPQLAFDGEHVWLSYITDRNDLRVGFFEANGHFSSTLLNHADRSAFQLQPADTAGRVRLLAATPTGFATESVCKVTD